MFDDKSVGTQLEGGNRFPGLADKAVGLTID